MGVLARLESTVADMTSKLDRLAERLDTWSWVEELAALHALQVQAQALLDMVMRLAAELGYRPTSPQEAARHLHDEGLLSREELDLIVRVTGLWNSILHEYAGDDMDLVYGIVSGREYRRLAVLAAKLLERAERLGLDP